jgi:hypothetical protein
MVKNIYVPMYPATHHLGSDTAMHTIPRFYCEELIRNLKLPAVRSALPTYGDICTGYGNGESSQEHSMTGSAPKDASTGKSNSGLKAYDNEAGRAVSSPPSLTPFSPSKLSRRQPRIWSYRVYKLHDASRIIVSKDHHTARPTPASQLP